MPGQDENAGSGVLQLEAPDGRVALRLQWQIIRVEPLGRGCAGCKQTASRQNPRGLEYVRDDPAGLLDRLR